MVDRKTYTPEEYQSSFIDYYGGFGGIDVKLAPDADGDDDGGDTTSSVLDSGYNQDDGAAGTNLGTSPYLPSTTITSVNYNDYIRDFGNDDAVKTKQGQDKSLSGFGDHILKNKDQYLVGAALSPAIPGIGALMGIGSHLYRKQTLKNANAIASVAKVKATESGGSMLKMGGRIVSRAPGERVYTGMTDQNAANAMEGISLGFIPRTWREDEVPETDGGGYTKTGKKGLIAGANGQSIMDPFGNYHHISGVQGAGGSRDMRENLLKNALENAGISTAGIDIRGDSVNLMMALNAHMSGKIGAFTTVRSMGTSEYNKALKDAQDFIADYAVRTYGSGTTEDDGGDAGAGTTSVAGAVRPSYASSAYRAPGSMGYEAGRTPADLARRRVEMAVGLPGNEERMAAAREEEAKKQAEARAAKDEERRQKEAEQRYQDMLARQQQQDDDDGGGGPQDYGQDTTSGYDFGGDSGSYQGYFADGGRVGMQMGGTAPQAAPAGFVERPPSQVSEAATVADDKPMSVPEGTFVINAAAVEIAGESDIAKMLNKAYENYRARGGKEVMGRTPSKEEVDVAVSRGEVLVPPAIAKIIGYDRLEKINNRGKKETSKRIEENGQGRRGAAGGGFLDVGKYAEGDEVIPTPKPSLVDRRRDEALADVELRADLESYIKNDKLARLGWDLYSKGEIDMTGVMLRNPNTGEDYAASSYGGFYFPKKGQEMYPGPVEVAKADTDQTVMPTLGKMQVGKDIRTDIPSIYYYAEKNPALEVRRDKDGKIINTPQEMSRAGVFITMAHELRHAALNYIHNEGKLKNVIGTPRAEERLMDYYDYHNRMTAAKSDPSVPSISPLSLQAGRQEFASFDPMQRELNEYYENIAAAALKGRKVPPRAKRIKKNFFEKFIGDLFN
jgi:hypothetical protein